MKNLSFDFKEIVNFNWMIESEKKILSNDIFVKNLYRFIFRREPKPEEIQEHINRSRDDLIRFFFKSNEFKKMILQNIIPKNNKILGIPYVIVKINDRALSNCNRIEVIMKSSEQHKLSFINQQEDVVKKFLLDNNIKINWDKKFFIRDYLKGELGVTASFVLIYQYMIDNNIDNMLVFEDDAVLKDNFLNNLYYCYNDLPDDFDYLVSSTVFPNAQITTTVNANILINSKYICKSHLQNSDLRVTLYSKNGVKKILNFLKQFGFACPIDTFIFNLARKNYLNGYTTFFQNSLAHNIEIRESLIDINKIRSNFSV
jgi:GR25 family glycosyltransferase involved in LPS biosynthesis